jgi:hypothetical protein
MWNGYWGVRVSVGNSLSLSLSIAAGAKLGFGFELSSPIAFFAISSLLFVDFQRIEIMRRIWILKLWV